MTDEEIIEDAKEFLRREKLTLAQMGHVVRVPIRRIPRTSDYWCTYIPPPYIDLPYAEVYFGRHIKVKRFPVST